MKLFGLFSRKKKVEEYEEIGRLILYKIWKGKKCPECGNAMAYYDSDPKIPTLMWFICFKCGHVTDKEKIVCLTCGSDKVWPDPAGYMPSCSSPYYGCGECK